MSDDPRARTVWTALLTDDGGGWVMGVFLSRDEALDKLAAYEAVQGGAVLGEPIHHHDSMTTLPILNSRTSRAFIIASHTLGVCDP
jgi:hypothetical protein